MRSKESWGGLRDCLGKGEEVAESGWGPLLNSGRLDDWLSIVSLVRT